jgi:hypothetical protein
MPPVIPRKERLVIPANAGIHFDLTVATWIPAFAGMTDWLVFAGMTNLRKCLTRYS